MLTLAKRVKWYFARDSDSCLLQYTHPVSDIARTVSCCDVLVDVRVIGGVRMQRFSCQYGPATKVCDETSDHIFTLQQVLHDKVKVSVMRHVENFKDWW